MLLHLFSSIRTWSVDVDITTEENVSFRFLICENVIGSGQDAFSIIKCGPCRNVPGKRISLKLYLYLSGLFRFCVMPFHRSKMRLKIVKHPALSYGRVRAGT